MQMPGLGSGYMVPDKYVAALQAGIRFFILRYPKRTEVDQTFHGPFDVIAGEEHDYQTNRTSHKMKWLTGRDAASRFQVQPNSDVAICYMPDDIFYHNRILVCDHPEYLIEGMHTSDAGIMPASEVIMEINCLRQEIYFDAPIWKIINPMKGNKEVDYAWSKEDAERIINTEKYKSMGAAGMPVLVKPYERCRIVEGTKSRKKPEIERMIQTYGRIANGWTDCEEFKNRVIPAVQARIDKMRHKVTSEQTPVTASDMKSHVLDVISSLSDEDIKKLRAIKQPEAPIVEEEDVLTPLSEETEQSQAEEIPAYEEAPIAQPEEGVVVHKEYVLKQKRVADLQKIAAGLGIETVEKTKAVLIEEILSSQGPMVLT